MKSCFRLSTAVLVAAVLMPLHGLALPEAEAIAGRALLKRYADTVVGVDLVVSMKGMQGDRPIPARIGASLFTAPLGVFWNRYVKHAGFRDGAHGFVAAALLAAYQLVEHAKVWEALHVHEEDPA